MKTIETKHRQFVMIFGSEEKTDYQRETIKVLLDEDRDVVWNGCIDSLHYNKKLRLFYINARSVSPADVHQQWENLINIIENPKYIICYWVRRSDEERREYQRSYEMKMKMEKNDK